MQVQDELIALRKQMAAEGWLSKDDLTTFGWKEGFGYSVWFERWDWHGKPLHGNYLLSRTSTRHGYVGNDFGSRFISTQGLC